MGIFAEAFVAYAQPLIDQTDGTEEDLDKALSLGQLCYNLSLLPDEDQERAIGEMRLTLEMNDEEFDYFRHGIIFPMIQRHREMFPRLHGIGSTGFSPSGPALRARSGMAVLAKAHPVTDRYAPCPCNSGRKYKFCCGKKVH